MNTQASESPLPHLFQLMTQHEFRLVFSLAFLASTGVFEDAYPGISRYPSPGSSPDAMDWEEAFCRTIRFLAFEHEFHFETLEIFTDGRIYGSVIAPDNDLYIAQLRMGNLPNLRLAMEAALSSRNGFPILAPGLDLQPLREAYAKVCDDLATTQKELEPAELLEEEAVRTAALNAIAARN